MAEEQKPGVWEQMLAKRAEWAAQQPSFSSEIRASAREAIKDIRNTVHETFFGKPEHMPEPGAPLQPTQAEMTKERGVVNSYQAMLEDAASRGAEGQDKEQDRGMGR
jgi:hypothetical protein